MTNEPTVRLSKWELRVQMERLLFLPVFRKYLFPLFKQNVDSLPEKPTPKIGHLLERRQKPNLQILTNSGKNNSPHCCPELKSFLI